MKNKKTLEKQPTQLNPLKNISPHKRSKEIREIIQSRRKDMKLLIAFAVGEKKWPHATNFFSRSLDDDQRFLGSLRELRRQVLCLEQELLSLKEDE
jgi:hypothetical protein